MEYFLGMKKILFISALLFSFNGFAEPSSSTSALLWNKSVPFMTFGLFACELKGSSADNFINSYKKIKFGGCNYNYDMDKLIIYFTKEPPDKEANQMSMGLCKDGVPIEFSWYWKAEKLKEDDMLFMGVPYLEYFYETGIVEAGRHEKMTKWLIDHVEVHTHIGGNSILSTEQKEGISCMYRMGRDSYTT